MTNSLRKTSTTTVRSTFGNRAFELRACFFLGCTLAFSNANSLQVVSFAIYLVDESLSLSETKNFRETRCEIHLRYRQHQRRSTCLTQRNQRGCGLNCSSPNVLESNARRWNNGLLSVIKREKSETDCNVRLCSAHQVMHWHVHHISQISSAQDESPYFTHSAHKDRTSTCSQSVTGYSRCRRRKGPATVHLSGAFLWPQ